MQLMQLLLDFLFLGFPRFTAVLLVLATALFGFCAYVFFSVGRCAGGIVFAVMAVATAALFAWMWCSGEFRRDSGRTPPNH